MVHSLFQRIFFAVLTFGALGLVPGTNLAEPTTDWGLAALDSLLTAGHHDSALSHSEGVAKAFERLQMFKGRVLLERLREPGRLSVEAVLDSLPLLSLSDYQNSTLEQGELFLDTYIGHEQSLVLAVTPEQCRLLVLPGDEELAPLLTKLHHLVAQPASDQVELKAMAAQVSQIMLGELKTELASCKRIILAPDGAFNLIPTCLLLPQNEEIEFVRVPSASILMDLRQTEALRPPVQQPRVLAVGELLDAETANLPGAHPALAKLDDTYARVTVIHPNGGGSLPDLEAMSGFDLIHVAAQAIGDDRHAWQSAIVLDPGSPDQMIRATDLIDLHLDTRLVVLARCSTARGQVLAGEGIQGLTYAFLAAGVPAVVATLWPVDDDATGFFMSAFYEGLTLGDDAAAALVFARKKCRENPVFNLPFHWSAFVLVGDNQVQIPLEAKSGFSGYLVLISILGAILLLVLSMVWVRHRRSS